MGHKTMAVGSERHRIAFVFAAFTAHFLQPWKRSATAFLPVQVLQTGSSAASVRQSSLPNAVLFGNLAQAP